MKVHRHLKNVKLLEETVSLATNTVPPEHPRPPLVASRPSSSSSSSSCHSPTPAPSMDMEEEETAAATHKDGHVAGAAGFVEDHGGGGGGPPRENNGNGGVAGAWEIEEIMESEEERRQRQGGAAHAHGGDVASTADDVYVAVGKSGSSMAALSWALRRLTKPRSFVYLVHVFPVVTSIPTPLGMMPKSQASPEQIETYLNQERSKRREMLQKYLDHCRNFQVIADVYLIESDQIANAITELIPVLHIKQIVLGVSKSNVRKLKRGGTIAAQVQKTAPLYCQVKIICDGKEVTTVATTEPTPPLSPSPVNDSSRSNNPTPASSTPNHDNAVTNGDRNDGKPRERRKIAKFLRCLSL